jgi:hypothetical protein
MERRRAENRGELAVPEGKRLAVGLDELDGIPTSRQRLGRA